MSLINDDTYGDYTIRLKTLEKEYDVLLKQYLEAKKNYIETLQNDAKGNLNYTIKSSTLLNGDSYKIIQDVASVEDCKSLCIENKCDGASYNTNRKDCQLNNLNLGTMSILEDPNYSAIVRTNISNLAIMGDIIFKLLDVNSKIIQTIENIDPSYQENIDAKKDRADELYANYKSLIGERDMVNSKMDEYSMLSQKFTDENINANKQFNILSALWFVLFVILLFTLREIFQVPVSFVPVFVGAIVVFLVFNLDRIRQLVTFS